MHLTLIPILITVIPERIYSVNTSSSFGQGNHGLVTLFFVAFKMPRVILLVQHELKMKILPSKSGKFDCLMNGL